MTEDLKYKPYNDRGFLAGDFIDLYNKECSIQESSLATKNAIWFGVNKNRMHLSQEMVRKLLPALIFFCIDFVGGLPNLETKIDTKIINKIDKRIDKILKKYNKE